ncbi:carboxypeptidase-like regulatory domain-containing protein [Actinoplanes sp. NBRC 103695]|uniref:carboxypeptidase-like regulatory domain-containing protein n=1 Tax=Actinoplanes sp. NBRC 103695 TaxID=3032202 RepID=UPI0024A5A8DA|nr:carboxypeptidase-like regulatory domain-containing protein [Actinoplanes sp. NBRC 103695]GLY98100.1 hypothetical protein Acsp02_53540 [Actinoplanes sp. NBRC 103695]
MLRLSLAALTAGAIILIAPAAPVSAAPGSAAPGSAAPGSAEAAAVSLTPPDRPQTGLVTGTFTDQTGAPIAGASVRSTSPDYNDRTTSTTTDARGRYLLEYVPAGPVRLTFRYNGLTQYAPGRPRPAEAQLYTVVPGLTTVVDERKVATGTVQGTLTDAAGAPIKGGSASVISEFGGALFHSPATDADGRYSIPGVPAGTFTMVFRAGSFSQWAHDAATQATATTFTVGGDQTVTVDESMRAIGSLGGRINRTTRSIQVFAFEVGSDNFLAADTDAEGRYTLPVPVGRWQVKAAGRQWVPREIDRADAQIFEVKAGKRTLVNDRLLPTGQVQASLRVGDPGRLSRWTFGLWHDGVLVATASGTSRGRTYFRNVLPGDYVFGYFRNGTNFFAPGTVKIENATHIKMRPGRTKRIGTLHPVSGTLTGRVTLPTGEPLPGIKARADVVVAGVTLSYTATTGPDGVWRMDRVFPETYRITLTNTTGRLSQDAGVVTTTSGATSTLDTAWQQGGAITVSAVDATTGAPVTGICVAVVAKFGDYCAPGSTVTAAGLEPDRTLVTLTPRGDKDYLIAKDVPATVTAGGNMRLTVPLTLGGRIHLEAHDRATGAPVRDISLLPVKVGAGTESLAYTWTNKSGKTTSEALPEGVYQLFVLGEGSSGSQWYTPGGGTGDQGAATRFRVRAGHTIKAGTALLDRAGTVSGVVRDPAGQPVAGVNVSPLAYRIPSSASPGSDSQGRYTVRGLGPYAWPLLFTPVFTPPSGLPRQWSGGTGNRFQAETVAVTSGVTSTYDMTMAAGTKVSGTVTVAPGGPAWTGGRLTARNAASGDILAVADFPGPGGAYEFTVIGGRPVTVDWYLADPLNKAAGWYDGAADLQSATKVPVPVSGTKRLDLTVG